MIWILTALFSGVCSVGQSTVTKIAATKNANHSIFHFNTYKVGAALLMFGCIFVFGFDLHIPTVLYSFIYGLALFFSSLFGYLALKNGSMALTSLIVSYSVIIPCLFGVIVLHEEITVLQIFGIFLLLLSMLLINKKSEHTVSKRLWFIYVSITFICNGVCSVIQKVHQSEYPARYINEFNLCSLTVTFILFLTASLIKGKSYSKAGRLPAIISGLLMGTANYLTLLLASKINATVLFPLISVFSMLCNVVVSKLYFKDTFRLVQLLGIGLGVLSVFMIK